MPPILYLIDGHALAYRSYYALTRGQPNDRWVTRSGEPTAGVYGFGSAIMRILEQEDPDYLAVAFDVGKTFRDELFPAYKATRAKMPDDLRTQIKRMRELVDAFNMPRLEYEGYEADDVLGSVARWAVGQGLGVKIFTGDRDLLQLVDERVIINLPGRSISNAKDYLAADVKAYMGVRPDQVVDYKALMGDSSDNIPGVAGVGKKTAATLLESYETLDGVYAHLDELKPGLRGRLEADRENAYLSQKLATIVTDLDIVINLEDARPNHFDPQAVRSLFRELEFNSLTNRLGNLEQRYQTTPVSESVQMQMFSSVRPPTIELSRTDQDQAQIINTTAALDSLVKTLRAAELIAFDVETTSTDPMQADLVGISLATVENIGYYIPVGHLDGKQLPLKDVIHALHDPMTNADIPKVGHNIKYDFIVLARYGLRVNPLSFDSMIAEWLINPASFNLSLKKLAWSRLGREMTQIEALIGKGKNQRSMAEVSIADAALYAADDAAVVLQLMPLLQDDLKTAQAMSLFTDMEIPLIKVLAEMEMAGIALDIEFLTKMSLTLMDRLKKLEQQVYQTVGTPFNLNSPKQLSAALFETLGIKPPPGTRKTATGYYSTAVGVLDDLKAAHPVMDLILSYREMEKLRSTYVDALPEQVNPETGRVHTSYNQAGSRTGRIASSNPNLQNIPIRTNLGRQVRHAFVAAPGNLLLAVDYSQVELRIAAHMSQDEAMLSAFRSGQDIHTTTAAAIYNIMLEEVSQQQRRHAKAINFGLIYGMSAFGLTRTTDLTLAEAENFVKTYFDKFPGIRNYIDSIREQAAKDGFVETLLGRRRYFPGLQNVSNQQVRRREEREAINAPIQGTAADIMKVAMLNLDKALNQTQLSARVLLQVHDEVVLECSQSDVKETAALVQSVMEQAYPLDIELRTDARAGINWGVLESISK
ncbi:MAG: DNA polymerase I [Anaerolineae bacterium]|nr:DNA polymerase I [Anaerolineae bacterium]